MNDNDIFSRLGAKPKAEKPKTQNNTYRKPTKAEKRKALKDKIAAERAAREAERITIVPQPGDEWLNINNDRLFYPI